jgi:small subunit ribosomal protein S18
MAERSNVRSRRGGRPRYVPRRKFCAFCKDKLAINYKESDKLRSYITDRGKIAPRRKTGTCARHQRILATAIKRARHLALLPHAPMHIGEREGAGARA